MHDIPGRRNELSDHISRNSFDALIGESSEASAKEAFQRMDVQVDLSMGTAGVLENWSLTKNQSVRALGAKDSCEPQNKPHKTRLKIFRA